MAGWLKALAALAEMGVWLPGPTVDSSHLPVTLAPADLTVPSPRLGGHAHSPHTDSRHTHTDISKNKCKMFFK